MTISNAEVFQIIADVLNVPVNEISPLTSPATVEGWDSVQHLNLVLALEAGLGIQFDPEEIGEMNQVSEILAIIHSKAG